MTSTHQFTQLPDVRLHHLEWAGGSPPIVYLPGFIANAYGALCLAAAVNPAHRVMALDLRGRGQSDKPAGTYGIDQHLSDLQNWLNQHEITRFVLAGHSFGAILALFYASQYPVEKLILLDGGAPPSEIAFQLFLAYHQNLTYHYPSAEAYLSPYRQMITLQPWTDEAEQLTRANIIEQPDGSAERAVPKHVVESELAHLQHDRLNNLLDLYSQIKSPVLLIRAGMGSFGKDDQHLTDSAVAVMQSRIADFRVYEMPTAGHTGILTVPDAGRDAALRDFLA